MPAGNTGQTGVALATHTATTATDTHDTWTGLDSRPLMDGWT